MGFGRILQKLLSTSCPKALIPCSLGPRQLYSDSWNKDWICRSWMFLSKDVRTWCENKVNNADVVVLDLEDSVPYESKSKYRDHYRKAIEGFTFKGKKVLCRVNSLDDLHYAREDISYLSCKGLSGFMLPKISNQFQMNTYDDLISEAESKAGLPTGYLKTFPIIETPESYFNMLDIAESTKRNVALINGCADMKAAAYHNSYSHTYYNVISAMVKAAYACGLQPVGGAYLKLKDLSGFISHCTNLQACGITGVATLTPNQTIIANQIFPHATKDVEWAQKVPSTRAHSSEHAINKVQMSVWESIEMIGPPHVKQAQGILDRCSNALNGAGKVSINSTSTSCNKANFKHSQDSGDTVSPNGANKSILKPGEMVQPCNRVIVTDAWCTAWNSVFPDCYPSSLDLFTKSGKVTLPFGLLLTLTVSLAVTEFSRPARYHLGFYDAFQLRPVSSDESLRAVFRIDTVKSTSSKTYIIADSNHWLVNQRDQVIFTLKKRTLFPSEVFGECHTQQPQIKKLMFERAQLYTDIINGVLLSSENYHANPRLTSKEIILHDLMNVIGESEMRSLCKLLHITNRHHHDVIKLSPHDIVVPGPFVIFAALSNTTKDLGEILYERIPVCININKVNPGDQISTLTLVEDIRPINSHIEELRLKHIGFNNVNHDHIDLNEITSNLFDLDDLKPAEIEKLCAINFPQLLGRICCYVERSILRDARKPRRKSLPFELIGDEVQDILE